MAQSNTAYSLFGELIHLHLHNKESHFNKHSHKHTNIKELKIKNDELIRKSRIDENKVEFQEVKCPHTGHIDYKAINKEKNFRMMRKL